MTPEERARTVVERFEGNEYWIDKDQGTADVAAAIRAAVEAERKECATIADSYDGMYHNTARHIAFAIRARTKV